MQCYVQKKREKRRMETKGGNNKKIADVGMFLFLL